MNVPYYHRRIPEEYFVGRGWRGWLIRVLNRLRWKIERYVAYLVMILIAREEAGLDEESVDALKVRFAEENEDTNRRRKATLAVLGLLPERETRYTVGRKNTPPPESKQESTESVFARYINHDPRYSHGREYSEILEVQDPSVPTVDMSES